MTRRQGVRVSMGTRFRGWALVLFCIIVECVSLRVQAQIQYSGNIPWFERLPAALLSGRAVVPADDGPYDYRVFRSAGEMAAQQGADKLYDTELFNRFERTHQMIGGPWMYPPPTITLMGVARLSDFGRGFLIWTAFLTMVSLLVLRAIRIPWLVTIATLFSPAAVFNFSLGQFGLISGALFVASMVWTIERPASAGIAAGLLTMKPQGGLLLPVIFLARWRLRAILMALVTFAVLVAISLALYGPGAWVAFLDQGLAANHKLLVAPFPTPYESGGISIFWMARSFGFGVGASYAIQAVGAFIAMVWCWLAWRDPEAAPWPRIALATCLATLVTPFGYIDDLCAFSLGIALLAWHRGAVRPADLLLWAWPGFAYLSVVLLHVLITPLVILLAAMRAHVEMKREAPERQRMEEVLRDVTAPTG